MNKKKHVPLPQDVMTQYMGGHTVERDGYLLEFCPYHKDANRWGYVSQHRLTVERSLGRYLEADEYIHHKDLDKHNNSIDNLQLVSRSEHMKIHRAMSHSSRFPAVTDELVRKALAEGGLKHAAKVLGVSTQTIRNHFPDLVEPYKRKSPTNLDNPEFLDKLRTLASDPDIGYREASEALGCSAESIHHVLRRNNIEWVRRSKAGEAHRRYVRKGTEYHYPEETVCAVRTYAEDPNTSFETAGKILHMSCSTIRRICNDNGIKWISKSNRRYPVLAE